MRLIDADELLVKVNKIKYLRKLRAKALCDECREVEAIPIDWLRERASRMLDFGEGVERIIQEWKDEQRK